MLCDVLRQAERLEELQESLSIPFDGSNPSHQDRLRELWRLAFPEVPCEALKTPKWKDMGWQVMTCRRCIGCGLGCLQHTLQRLMLLAATLLSWLPPATLGPSCCYTW